VPQPKPGAWAPAPWLSPSACQVCVFPSSHALYITLHPHIMPLPWLTAGEEMRRGAFAGLQARVWPLLFVRPCSLCVGLSCRGDTFQSGGQHATGNGGFLEEYPDQCRARERLHHGSLHQPVRCVWFLFCA